MKIHLGTKPVREIKKAIVTTGTFDGVHFGHQKILARLRQAADELNGETVMLTYWPHPRMVLKHGNDAPKLLSTFPEKANLLEKHGIDHLVKIPFTKAFSQMSPQEYIRVILHERLNTSHLIIGYDHRFGKNREGGLEDLRKHADRYQYKVEEIPKQDIDENGVSSTRIRKALEMGDVRLANQYLGREYSITGMVVKGKQLGRTLGYPTANVNIKETYKLIPADGIYAVRVCNQYKKLDGMLNIGCRPTVGGHHKTIEVHIFDFHEDIYNAEISIEFIKHLRKEVKFDSADALRAQLRQDEQAVRCILSQISR